MSIPYLSFNSHGLEIKSDNDEYSKTKKKILDQIENQCFEFINVLKKNKFSEISRLSKKFKKFENVVFLGTGGSSLGGKTLFSLKNDKSQKKNSPSLFFVENVDSFSMSNLIKKINLDRTGVVVISKSGETLGTLAQYFYIVQEMRKKKIILKEKFLVITEKKMSTLKKIQETERFEYFQHEKDVGGRFSVFSIVGLFPAALVGLDIKFFCDGARKFLDYITHSKSHTKNFDHFFLSTYAQYKLIRKGKNISVFMPYVDCLKNFSLWLRQLWAESIGKKGMGSTLVNALGTVDQHSQLQLYLDGPRDKFFTILGRTKRETLKKDKIKCFIGEKEKYLILHNKTIDELMYAEMQATFKTIEHKGLPCRIITLDEIDEQSIGALMMFFFLETIFTCYLFNVDPFDQPAVEEIKILTKKFLA